MKQNNPQISIIIPVFNEAQTIAQQLSYLKENSSPSNIAEIIVVDGGSNDTTTQIAATKDVLLIHSKKGRATQMNAGAKNAGGDILYFLHVDTVPPIGFDTTIIEAFKAGSNTGCFQLKFDSNSTFLKFFAWFTRINSKLCRGGDQSLYISKSLFEKSGGYNEDYFIYEDNELINRLYDLTDFTVLPQTVKTSARKYEQLGVFRLQYHFAVIHIKKLLGAGPEQLYDYYKRKIAV